MNLPPPRPPPWFPPLPASIRPKTVGPSIRTTSPMKKVTLPSRNLAPGPGTSTGTGSGSEHSTSSLKKLPGPPPSPPPFKAPPRPPPQSIRTHGALEKGRAVPMAKTSSPTPPPGYRKRVLFGTPYGADRRPSPKPDPRPAPGPQRVALGSAGSSRAAPYVVTPELRQGRVAPGAYMAHSEYHRPESMDVPIAPAGPLPATSTNSFPKVLYVHSIPISVLSQAAPAPRALHLVQPNVSFPMSFQFTGPTTPFTQRRRPPGVPLHVPLPPPPRPAPVVPKKLAKNKQAARAHTKAAVAAYERKQREEKLMVRTALESRLKTLETRLAREKDVLEAKMDRIRALEAEMDGVCADIEVQEKKLEAFETGGVAEGEAGAEGVVEDVTEPATISEDVDVPEKTSDDVEMADETSEDVAAPEVEDAQDSSEDDDKDGEES